MSHILSRSQLASTSVLRRFISAFIKSHSFPRSVSRAALIACLADIEPDSDFEFLIRLDNGKRLRGVFRVVTLPSPDVNFSDTLDTLF